MLRWRRVADEIKRRGKIVVPDCDHGSTPLCCNVRAARLASVRDPGCPPVSPHLHRDTKFFARDSDIEPELTSFHAHEHSPEIIPI
jgi:hypothetical protein